MKPAPSLPHGHRRFLIGLAIVYLLLTIVLGIAPRNRTDWWMEHFIVAFGIFPQQDRQLSVSPTRSAAQTEADHTQIVSWRPRRPDEDAPFSAP